jgi:uncharacterized phiE125 gp8 family phage protein
MRQIKINSTTGSEIITVNDVKNFVRIDTSADDALIGTMITAARIAAENFMSRDIVAKTRTYYLPSVRFDLLIDVPFGPIASIQSVTGTVDNTALQYTVFGLDDKIIELIGDAVNIKIYYTTAGMNDGLLKQALLMMVSTYYDNRTDFVTGTIVQDVPSSAQSILNGYKAMFV